WDITVDKITAQDPLARLMLDVLAYLAPDQLPEAVLAPLADDLARNNALALLASYSMITRSDGHISMHRLVQAITRDRQPNPTNPASSPTHSKPRSHSWPKPHRKIRVTMSTVG